MPRSSPTCSVRIGRSAFQDVSLTFGFTLRIIALKLERHLKFIYYYTRWTFSYFEPKPNKNNNNEFNQSCLTTTIIIIIIIINMISSAIPSQSCCVVHVGPCYRTHRMLQQHGLLDNVYCRYSESTVLYWTIQ